MRLRGILATIVALSLCIWPIAASATLLYSGGTGADFFCDPGGSCSSTTASSTFRAGWAKESYQVTGTTADPPTNRFATAVFTGSASLWAHGQFCNLYSLACGSNTNTNSNSQMLRLIDSNNNPALVVRGTGTAGSLKISSRSATGTFTDLVTCPSAFGINPTQLDIYANYSSSGEVALYNNSVKVCDFIGNVTNGDGATTLNKVEFSAPYAGGAWSEIIVATTDTRAMARFTANTVGNGNTIGFLGTNVCSAIWGSTGLTDTTYGYSGSANVLHECTINSAIPPGAYNVLSLTMSARALVGSSGPQHFDFLTRTSGTDYPSADFAPLNSFSNIVNYMQTINPATSAPWAVSDFQDPTFNVGEETKP
jgi:hypothetical protein